MEVEQDLLNRVLAANMMIQDDTMTISPQERQWAMEIKQAVNESEDLKPLTDFDYVQYAMVTLGNTQEALFRIAGMQAFREEYGIDNSVEQAVDHLDRAMQMLPGFILHLDNCPHTNEAIMVWDASVCYPQRILSINPDHGPDHNWKTYVVAHYYMTLASQPTLFSVRDGLTLLIDCGQVGWENVSMDFQRRMNDELRGFYPLKWKRILAYNTAVIANVGWSLFKQFMSPHMRESLKLGCQVAGSQSETRLCQLFLQPSLEGAKDNILGRFRTLLLLRHQKAMRFRLDR